MTAPPDPFSAEADEDPYPVYARMREDFPLLWHEGAQTYVVTRYEDVARVFKETGSNFSPEAYTPSITPFWGPTILSMSGKHHAGVRKGLNSAMRGDSLERLAPKVEEIAKALVSDFVKDGKVELVSQFTRVYPINVILAAEDIPAEDVEKISRWYRAALNYLENVRGDPEVNEAGERARDEIASYLPPLVEQRRECPAEDWVSRLVNTIVEGEPMSPDEIRGFTGLMWSAGGDTTDKALGSTMLNLLQNPDQLKAVQQDRSLIEKALVETIRYSPPVLMNPRIALEDVEMTGGVIEKGKMVQAVIGSANRDPSHFKSPDEFDLFRDDLDLKFAFTAGANHLGFGPGPHHCIGSWLARREVEIAANLFFDTMSDLRFAADAKPRCSGVILRGPVALDLEFTPV